MKKILASAAFALLLCGPVQAQTAYPEGMAVYALPSTVISLEVTAVKSSFTAGPYAKYARKYLGTQAETSDKSSWSIKSVSVKSRSEADLTEIHSLRISSSNASSSAFLKFTSQGLVMFADGGKASESTWSLPVSSSDDGFSGKDMGENLTSVTTTLYKGVKSESGFSKVAVQQSEVVEKSIEKKAEEAAQRIFDLRRSRFQISTGDTDATFSGEALGAALAEISKMEDEYLSLFFGVTEISEQKACFDVVPTTGNARQMYVAFRISDEEGLLPSGSTEGRPVILSLNAEKSAVPALPADKKKLVAQAVYYRIPATVTARLMDGQTNILTARMPVYQLGTIVSFPL